MSLINTCNLLLTNLHRCLDEAVKAVYGFAPLPVAGSLVDRAAFLKVTFDENPSAFVATPTHLAALNSLLAEYRQQAFLANTTTITVEATRLIAWNDVINKPVKFPPKAHAHDYASITGKPTTFEPSAHAHDYASITDKPTTFEPSSHAHVYADITDAPTSLPMAAHSHAYADITSKPTTFAPSAHSHAATAYVRYAGNGATGRILTLSAAIMPTTIFIMRDDVGLNLYWATPLYAAMCNLTAWLADTICVATGAITLTTAAAGNAAGKNYTLLAWGNAS